jgi:hypothetical protein
VCDYFACDCKRTTPENKHSRSVIGGIVGAVGVVSVVSVFGVFIAADVVGFGLDLGARKPEHLCMLRGVTGFVKQVASGTCFMRCS